MSHFTSSLAFEGIKQSSNETELTLLDKSRHLSISNAATDSSPACQVIKVSGSITVSF